MSFFSSIAKTCLFGSGIVLLSNFSNNNGFLVILKGFKFGSADRLSYSFLGLNFEKNKTKIIYLWLHTIFIFYFDKRRKKRNCWKEFKKWSSQAKKHIFLVLSMDSWSCKKNVGHKWENNMERKSFCSCSALCVQFFFSPGPKSQQVKSINIHHFRAK